MRYKLSGIALGVVSVLVSLHTNRSLGAAEISWANPLGGLFQNAANWDGEQVPGELDSAAFSLSEAFTVGFDSDVTNQRLRVQEVA